MLTVVWLALAGSATLWGLDYYLLPLQDRAYSDLAESFSPTGFVGHGLGIVGTALMTIGVVGYILRKRVPALAGAGSLRHWLQVHIFLCTLGPFFVLLHTTFKFGGIVSVSFWSMAIVVASGVFGRYVYVRIPKTINGRFLDLETVRANTRARTESLRALLGDSADELGDLMEVSTLPSRPPGLTRALVLAAQGDLDYRRRKRRMKRFLRQRNLGANVRADVLGLTEEQARLRQQALLLQPFQRLFRYWHVMHLPLAVVMFMILGIHVTVAILFGYTWIF